MGLYIISLSDVGEGVAEAELIEWHVAVGDSVVEDQVLGAVMTDKAAVDVPSSVLGKVVKLFADVGDVVAVGSPLIQIEIEGPGNADAMTERDLPTDKVAPSNPEPARETEPEYAAAESRSEVTVEVAHPVESRERSLAAPSVRQRARDLGVDINTVQGSGPGGRVVHVDLDRFTERRANPQQRPDVPNDAVTQVKIVGMRRKIAEKMSLSASRIPHITIVEEIDVQNLDELRLELNEKYENSRGKLTILPFVMKSIIESVAEQPSLNARFNDEEGVINQHSGVHIGIATQTPDGLVVPVVQHSEMNSLWTNAGEITRLSLASREGTITRDDLTDSTITITSLGPLGAIATTPIINYPEVAIVGINKIMTRPHWDGQQFVPRQMMNLSCSFDHRVVDGWDAAVFVQRLKSLLENPAMLFVDS